VLDDGTPDESVAECCAVEARDNLFYKRSDRNRGFVATCNWGYEAVAPPDTDILLLNSDTEVTSGFLEEMLRVLYLSERHGVVIPRSNNADIFSIPSQQDEIAPEESFRIWQELQSDLTDYSVIPTVLDFCMLIKAEILERFGLFDEIYSPGSNEEHDFVCRINRYGYSAVIANGAFVYHYAASTLGTARKKLHVRNHKLLVDRYPEYEVKISNYLQHEIDPVERFAILRSKHRPSVLFDLSHLQAKHNGSSDLALNLLREIHTQTRDEWDLFVGVSEEARFFSNELNGYRLFEYRPGSEMLFDVAFKPAQFFTWSEFRRINRLAPRLSLVLLDIIAIRCDYLAGPDRKTIFRNTIELADQVFSISRFSHRDLEAYFGTRFHSHTIHLGTNAGLTPSEIMNGEYVLLVGNTFAHKCVREAAGYLTGVGPIKILGGDKPEERGPAHVQWLTSGNLTRTYMRELYSKCNLVVYPSQYEGYGLPIIEGLALNKPVVAMDTEVNRELANALKTDRLILVKSLCDLTEAVRGALGQMVPEQVTPAAPIRRWRDVAEEYVAALRILISQQPDAAKIRARDATVRLLDSAHHV
jgi:glycosyltransferase involved in cell wall biosynthesis